MSLRKSGHSTIVPVIGDVVLIKEDLPRGSWKLGKIVQLIPSRDKEVRAAKVQLASKKIFSRALNQLYPLECGSSFKSIGTSSATPEKTLNLSKEESKRSLRSVAVKAKENIRRMMTDLNRD